MLHLAEELSFVKIAALAKSNAMAILPIGATEAHGPHLPLNVDVIISQEVARRVATRVDFDLVMFPPMAYSLADFAEPFSGTISLQSSVAHAWLVNVLTGIQNAGFHKIGIINHHLEPAHFRLVHKAAIEAKEKTGAAIIVADHRKPPTGPLLGVEFMQGGSHAGQYETSLMLAAAPNLVDETERLKLPQVEVNLVAVIQSGAKNFIECGGPHAYFGSPRAASAQEGHALFEIIADFTASQFRNQK
jgi:creatinine amidohydrolase